jgi:hypothetical protein
LIAADAALAAIIGEASRAVKPAIVAFFSTLLQRRIVARIDRMSEKFLRRKSRAGAVHLLLSRRFLQKIGRIGRKRQQAAMAPRQRKEFARKAALMRWAKTSPAERSEAARQAALARHRKQNGAAVA